MYFYLIEFPELLPEYQKLQNYKSEKVIDVYYYSPPVGYELVCSIDKMNYFSDHGRQSRYDNPASLYDYQKQQKVPRGV